jgi:GntR family transcriptional regulator
LEKTIDPTSFKPLYLQISEILRDQIKSGTYTPGDVLPSENELLDQFSVSRNTAQRAIEDLVRDGLAIRVQGKGTYVPKSLVNFGLHRLTSFSEEMRFKGLEPSSKILRFEREQPVEKIARKLHLEPEDDIYNLARIRYGDDYPMAIQNSSLPVKLCPNLEKYDFRRESLFNVLEKDYQLRITWQSQDLKPCNARKEEASALEIDLGTPLLYLEGVAYLERDIPIEFKQIYYRSDLYDFSMRSIRR